MILYIILALIIAWLLALELRHHSLKADTESLLKALGSRVRSIGKKP